ncbi:hypothetical protein EW146_g7329 [Bondarzewia mesenterica]|uniref:Dienelactone hydrolase domain-containing protein n=1 Tax=Bondarzewia mesenterica TaxID=1095465 RepID=A0A4S4LL32_9AGAM|nr:hypothetical protein EW146_g7329 [Bondarzewia mesenterica]
MSTTTGPSTYTVHNDNAACCTVPAVESDYKPKGTVGPYAGFNSVYMTGHEDSPMALVCVFDIFGIKPQTQLGADILASTLQARVVMPDVFEPHKPWDLSHFPPKTDKEHEDLQRFFGGIAKPQATVPKIERIAEALKKDGAKCLGLYGFCWGGKVAILEGSRKGTLFDAVAITHPAMLKAEDAKHLGIPLGIYPSGDESVDEYKKILNIIEKKPFADKNDHKLYDTMFHGFAAARANLDDPENKKQFEDVYARMANFFKVAFA